jgi:Fe-S cluster assembly protein SufB
MMNWSQELTKELVKALSEEKNEPGWMTDFRLRALEIFLTKPMPSWGADLTNLSLHDLCFYLKPPVKDRTSWDEVPQDIKKTFDALGILQAEQRYLAGVGAQYESEVIYKSLKARWQAQGVIFVDTNNGLRQSPDLFKKYFATVIPPHDNKFAALNSAVWSGGSFIYVPSGVIIDEPLQAYFRINAQRMGQFERTLIIADKGSSVHYVEGCSAPVHSSSSLHSAVVELVALPGAHIRYTTIQNWSSNVYNLVTKRAIAYRNAQVMWVDGNFGSKVTMKYPAVILKEEGSRADIISVAVAGKNQHQDAGAKVIHLAPRTNSSIVSKSISQHGGRATYRGLLKVAPGAVHIKARVQCDALMLDVASRSDTYPTLMLAESDVDVGHEASVHKLDDDHIFYLMSRGLQKSQAQALMINGFIDSFVQLLPMEYAVEINRLIAHEMEGSLG